MKVLIVEDDSASRAYMKDSVESQGHQTRVAEDGLKGLEVFQEFKPKLVITDIQMPGMNGLELLKNIRAISQETLVVVITAYGSEEYAIEALRLGANNYLKKPIRLNGLVQMLEKYSLMFDREPITGKEIEKGKPGEKITLQLENNLHSIAEVVDDLLVKAKNFLDSGDLIDVRTGLYELFYNAMEHGNLEISAQEKLDALNSDLNAWDLLFKERLADGELAKRKLTVEFKVEGNICEWVISDEGKGFDWKTILQRFGLMDFNNETKGIYICEFCFDSLEYIGNGNVVKACKTVSL